MTDYRVEGPFDVPSSKSKRGAKNLECDDFWNKKTNKFKEEKGIYVYALRMSAAQKFKPFYVGQTKRTFGNEIFNSHKVLKYQKALNNWEKAKPYMYFVVYPLKRGRINKKEISQIEAYLIRQGYIINPEIENDKGIKGYSWKISGVTLDSTKKQSRCEKEFSKMFGLEFE